MQRLIVVMVFVFQTLVAPIAFGATGMHALASGTAPHASTTDVAAVSHVHMNMHEHADAGLAHVCCEPGGHCSPGIVQLRIAQPGAPAPSHTPAPVAPTDLSPGVTSTPYRPPSLTS